MPDQFRTDKWALEQKQLEFIQAEVEAQIKEYEVQVTIGGKRVAATIDFQDGCIVVDVETPVNYL